MPIIGRRGLVTAGVGVSVGVGSYWGINALSTRTGRRLAGNRLVSLVPTCRPEIALTFDDGPDPLYSLQIADALGEGRATFFVVGERVCRYPEVVAALDRRGHEIASHGYAHRKLTRSGPLATVQDLRASVDAVRSATGSSPRYYRPPHGLFNLAAWFAAPRLGLARALWSDSSRDWHQDATPESIVRAVLDVARPGAVILMHDGHANGDGNRAARTLAAIPAIIDGLEVLGLRSVTLSCLEAAA